jgi:subtilisin family serine protease
MKTKVLIYALATMSVLFSQMQPIQAENMFYYYWNEKIFIKERTDKIFLKMDLKAINKERLTDFKNSIKSFGLVTDIDEDDIMPLFIAIETKTGNDIPSILYENYKANAMVVSATPMLQYNEVLQGLTDEFMVHLKPSSSYGQLQQLAQQNNCIIVKDNWPFKDQYMLSVSKTSKLNSLQMANLFYETGLFEYASPNFVILNPFHSSDPYFDDQWGLKNTGQYGGEAGVDIKTESAWTVTQGNPSIKIAVIDTGTELDHPDLASNLLPGFDASGNNSEGAPVLFNENHGTACSGIIGAIKDNGIGISGVAPNCKIIPVHASRTATSLPYDYLIDAFRWAWRNGKTDVISNSWGGGYPNPSLTSLIDSVAAYGRNGLGSVIVFSSGNGNSSVVSYPANLSSVIAVGAVSPCGKRKSPTSCDTETTWGSNYGNQLDVVAPGVLVPTTDRQDSTGYNPDIPIHTGNGGTKRTADFSNQDYTVWFNGTSAACPHVAGVAALVLSVNPNLTGQQVRDIIESTAQKVGGYNYQTKPDHPNGIWNEQMGYGLLDAYAAVVKAWSMLPISGTDEIDYCSGRKFSIYNLPGATYSWTASPNIEIVSGQTASTVKVKGKSYNATNSWIRLTVVYNGQTYVKERPVAVNIPNQFVLTPDDWFTELPDGRIRTVIRAIPLPEGVKAGSCNYQWSAAGGTVSTGFNLADPLDSALVYEGNIPSRVLEMMNEAILQAKGEVSGVVENDSVQVKQYASAGTDQSSSRAAVYEVTTTTAEGETSAEYVSVETDGTAVTSVNSIVPSEFDVDASPFTLASWSFATLTFTPGTTVTVSCDITGCNKSYSATLTIMSWNYTCSYTPSTRSIRLDKDRSSSGGSVVHTYQVQLYNDRGYIRTTTFTSNETTVLIPLTGLPNGNYYINVLDEQNRIVERKFILVY